LNDFPDTFAYARGPWLCKEIERCLRGVDADLAAAVMALDPNAEAIADVDLPCASLVDDQEFGSVSWVLRQQSENGGVASVDGRSA